jgi:uncharacterized repeat protein (TIGR01451 family)
MKKRALYILFGIVLATIAAAPKGLVFAVDEDAPHIGCDSVNAEEFEQPLATLPCDLSLKKDVSVSAGTYQDADTSSAAASARIGDMLTYRITISNTNETSPYGVYYVKDVLPASLAYVSSDATTGGYDPETHLWTFNDTTIYPAVLAITATVVSGGTIDNVANLEYFANCDSECGTNDYIDDVLFNNSDHAYVTIASAPQVLGASTTTPAEVKTLAATGSSPLPQTFMATILIAVTLLVARRSRPKTD